MSRKPHDDCRKEFESPAVVADVDIENIVGEDAGQEGLAKKYKVSRIKCRHCQTSNTTTRMKNHLRVFEP